MTDCIPVIHQLRTEFKGSLLAYSVEVDEAKAGTVGNALHSQMVEEMIHSIDAAADYEDALSTPTERSTWVAIKLVRHQKVIYHSMFTSDRPDSHTSRPSCVGQTFSAFGSIETLFLHTIPRKSNTSGLGYPHNLRWFTNPVAC